MRARRAGLAAYTDAFEAKQAECDWTEILQEAQLTERENEIVQEQMGEDIVRGYNEWKGDKMSIKQDNVGCRLVVTNAAKKLMTELDVINSDGATETILHLDYLIEYMQTMRCSRLCRSGECHRKWRHRR